MTKKIVTKDKKALFSLIKEIASSRADLNRRAIDADMEDLTDLDDTEFMVGTETDDDYHKNAFLEDEPFENDPYEDTTYWGDLEEDEYDFSHWYRERQEERPGGIGSPEGMRDYEASLSKSKPGLELPSGDFGLKEDNEYDHYPDDIDELETMFDLTDPEERATYLKVAAEKGLLDTDEDEEYERYMFDLHSGKDFHDSDVLDREVERSRMHENKIVKTLLKKYLKEDYYNLMGVNNATPTTSNRFDSDTNVLSNDVESEESDNETIQQESRWNEEEGKGDGGVQSQQDAKKKAKAKDLNEQSGIQDILRNIGTKYQAQLAKVAGYPVWKPGMENDPKIQNIYAKLMMAEAKRKKQSK